MRMVCLHGPTFRITQPYGLRYSQLGTPRSFHKGLTGQFLDITVFQLTDYKITKDKVQIEMKAVQPFVFTQFCSYYGFTSQMCRIASVSSAGYAVASKLRVTGSATPSDNCASPLYAFRV